MKIAYTVKSKTPYNLSGISGIGLFRATYAAPSALKAIHSLS